MTNYQDYMRLKQDAEAKAAGAWRRWKEHCILNSTISRCNEAERVQWASPSLTWTREPESAFSLDNK